MPPKHRVKTEKAIYRIPVSNFLILFSIIWQWNKWQWWAVFPLKVETLLIDKNFCSQNSPFSLVVRYSWYSWTEKHM